MLSSLQGAADPATYEQELARIYLEKVVGNSGGGGGGAASGGAANGGAAPAAAADGPPPEAAAEYAKLQQLVRRLGLWSASRGRAGSRAPA